MVHRCVKYLVIGGSGFLGRHLVDDLIEHLDLHCADTLSEKHISVLDIRRHPDYDTDPKYTDHVAFFVGDLCDRETVRQVLVESGAEVVFHTATPPPFAHSDILTKVNVDGTRTLLDLLTAPRSGEQGIRVNRLVMASSSSVVYSGQDIVDADERWEYARKGHSLYTDTKIKQERLTLRANSPQLRTCCIRPAAIFGPRDELFFPSVLKSAKSGRFRVIIGDGKNVYSFTYVKNVTHAMILASEKLAHPETDVGGEAFFVTNDETVPHWEFLCQIVEHLGYRRPTIHIPHFIMFVIMTIIATVVTVLNLLPHVNIVIPAELSLDKLAYVTCNRTFRCEKAKKMLGYRPKFSLNDALDITCRYYAAEYAKESSAEGDKPVKEH